MPRPLLPPRFALASIAVLLNPKVSHAEFRVYTILRALAWGEDTLRINFSDLETVTGLSRSTVLGYARALRLNNALLWHCAEDVFECLFTPPSGKEKIFSLNPEEPDSLISIRSQKKIPEKKNRNSESGKPGFEPEATVTAVCDAYKRLLGYTPAHLAKGETKAARWIGDRYTVAELEAAYRYYKAQPFWHDKPLTLRQLQTLLPEYLASKGVSHATSARPDDPAQHDHDLALQAELDALG